MNKMGRLLCAAAVFAAGPRASQADAVNEGGPSWSRLADEIGVSLPQLTGKPQPTGWAFGQTHGKPKATLICLHGIQTHADWFAELGRESAREGWLLLCPDRRGSGRSARDGNHTARLEPKDAGGEVWATDLKPVFAAAKEKGAPIFLVGTSWGAKVALYAAAYREKLFPEARLSGLILLVPATPAEKETGATPLIVSLANLFFPEAVFGGLRPKDYLRKDCPPAEAAALERNMKLDSGKNVPPGRLMDAGQTARLLHEGMRLEKLGLAGCEDRAIPTIAIFSRGDQIVAKWPALQRLEKIAGTLTFLEDAGHAVQVEAPDKVISALRPWLKGQLERVD